ncbi:MAG: YebC/PmpR family DNA-binding transcriptional regulator [Vampirovibrionales bacterium]
MMMAGHSKWAQIKRTKAVKDAKKGASFAKFSKEIMVAVKLGGADPSSNFRLRTAIEKAKEVGTPNDNIKRAIEKASGSGEDGSVETLIYEGYGPGGAAILIEAMSENRNRTAGDVRSLFTKYQGNMGAEGCVAWMFEEYGECLISMGTLSEDVLFEASIEAGATDFEADPSIGYYRVISTPETLNMVATSLAHHALKIEVTEVQSQRHCTTQAPIQQFDHAYPLIRLLDALEGLEDVRHVFCNADIAEDTLAQVERKLASLH